jgi:hypothetical protein
MTFHTRLPARRTAALAAFSAMLLAAPAADATKPAKNGDAPAAPAAPTTAETCAYTGASVFAPWNDNRLYTLIQDGGFENGADGWTLGAGAAVAEGNETSQVGGPADHQSLALPAGSSATSPGFCVEKHAAVFRLFARTDGSRKSRLRVDVVYANGRRAKSLKLRAGEAWAPSRKLGVALGRAKGKGKLTTATVSLRFTPVGKPANWQIDDVYLDPRLRH